MLITGYENDPLVDGSQFLTDSLFWPTYLSDTMTSHDDSLVTAPFEVDQEDCWNYYERLTDPDAWPVFRLGLREGHEIDVVYRNVTGAGSTEFVLCRSGGEYKLDLANVGGREFRPGLSWPELMAAADWSGTPYGVVEPDARLLLLLPAFGDADLPAEATAMVTAALTSCGAGPGARELAEWLLEDPEEWPHWRQQSDGALVCDDRYSRRNPEGPAAHSPADLLEISLALRVA
ncbi:hypothetical protein U2F26_25535 [Micromonospora sp. 4G57]|uniref:SMI1/KNR4 family protein n=1 Tax=Micromonospora sicca TaxID=2202420 RepID=A0ABU5JJV8_9ACTN|nr:MULTISPECIES: hypothetical protein [unclassified Micromonospora]MDZ5446055.1 hypothetical protein [Micromonospora sp. 4G57]MDZ5492812.1 hypothetical protein [Micromonospora sp. 4G53]